MIFILMAATAYAANNYSADVGGSELVGLWSFDSQNWNDSAASSSCTEDANNLTTEGTPTYEDADYPISGDSAFSYHTICTTSQRGYLVQSSLCPANFPGKASWSNQSFTAAGFFKITAFTNTGNGLVGVSATGTEQAWVVGIWLNGANENLFFNVGDGVHAPTTLFLTDHAIATGVWYHFAAVFTYNDGTNNDMYLRLERTSDGEVWTASGTTNYEADSGGTQYLQIGRFENSGTTYNINGEIEDVSVWLGNKTDDLADMADGVYGATTTLYYKAVRDDLTDTPSQIRANFTQLVGSALTQVGTNDDDYLDYCGTDPSKYVIFAWMDSNDTDNTKALVPLIRMKGNYMPAKLDCYNFTTSEWVNVDTETSQDNETEFVLTNTIVGGVSNFYEDVNGDGSLYRPCCRAYIEAE